MKLELKKVTQPTNIEENLPLGFHFPLGNVLIVTLSCTLCTAITCIQPSLPLDTKLLKVKIQTTELFAYVQPAASYKQVCNRLIPQPVLLAHALHVGASLGLILQPPISISPPEGPGPRAKLRMLFTLL